MLGVLPFQLLSFPSAPRGAKVFAWFSHALLGHGGPWGAALGCGRSWSPNVLGAGVNALNPPAVLALVLCTGRWVGCKANRAWGRTCALILSEKIRSRATLRG